MIFKRPQLQLPCAASIFACRRTRLIPDSFPGTSGAKFVFLSSRKHRAAGTGRIPVVRAVIHTRRGQNGPRTWQKHRERWLRRVTPSLCLSPGAPITISHRPINYSTLILLAFKALFQASRQTHHLAMSSGYRDCLLRLMHYESCLWVWN